MNTTKGVEDLARVMQVIARGDIKGETVANQFMDIVRANRVDSVERWQALTEQAYAANGWKTGQGKPRAGEKYKGRATTTVKHYVNRIKTALTYGWQLSEYKTMGQLRKAIKARDARDKARHTPVFLRGVKFDAPGEYTGAPLHDLGTVFGTLDDEQKKKLTKKLEALVDEFKSTKRFRDLTVVYGMPVRRHQELRAA